MGRVPSLSAEVASCGLHRPLAPQNFLGKPLDQGSLNRRWLAVLLQNVLCVALLSGACGGQGSVSQCTVGPRHTKA